METQPYQTLLEEIAVLPATEALQRIESLLRSHPTQPKRGTDPWFLLQEVRFREAGIALDTGLISRCLEALRACDWREANEVEALAVRSTLSTHDFGGEPVVVPLRAGGYRICGPSDDEKSVTVARLSANLELELMLGRLPLAAHREMELLAGFPDSARARLGESLTKAAFHLHSAGRSEVALGLLEVAVARGMEHPALLGSRQALLSKGFVADPQAERWVALYLEPTGSRRTSPRVSIEVAQENRLREIKRWIGSGAQVDLDSDAGRWALQATPEELEVLLTAHLLFFLAIHAPEVARALAAKYQGEPCVYLVEAHLALGNHAQALELMARMPLAQQFQILTRLSQGEAVSRREVRPSNPSVFFESAKQAARLYALDSDPDGGVGLKKLKANHLEFPDVESAKAARWLAKHDSEFPDWIEANADGLPLESLMIGAEHGPRLGWTWVGRALEQGECRKATRLWIEVAHSGQRMELESELRGLYPKVLQLCLKDGLSSSENRWSSRSPIAEVVRSAGPWNDLSELIKLGREHGVTISAEIAQGLSEFPEGVEWARQLSHSTDPQERLFAIAILRASGTTRAIQDLALMTDDENDGQVLHAVETALASLRGKPDLAPDLAEQGRPALRLKTSRAIDSNALSRAGGLPDLPDETWWPAGMRFLLQINLDELAQTHLAGKLPGQGYLSIFLEVVDDQSLEDGFCDVRVFHITEPVRRVSGPLAIEPDRECRVEFVPFTSYPWHIQAELGFDDDHRLLGWYNPYPNIGRPDEETWEGTEDYRLLLELASDAEVGWDWLDEVGRLHFLIPAVDLSAGRFDRVKLKVTYGG